MREANSCRKELGCNGLLLLRRMEYLRNSMRRNTPAAIDILLIAGYGLMVVHILLCIQKLETL